MQFPGLKAITQFLMLIIQETVGPDMIWVMINNTKT